MSEEGFSSGIRFAATDLHYEPFVHSGTVREFDCGNKDLNEFLNTAEVRAYQDEGLGETTLVYHKGQLVAYYTTSADSLRLEYLKTYKSFTRFAEMHLEALPAVKIGRLAVDKTVQGRGIGRLLMRRIIGETLARSGFAVRLLVLNSKPESIQFYNKLGFQLTDEVRRERGRRNRTMFFDLNAVRGIVD